MKKLPLILLIAIIFISCKEEKKEVGKAVEETKKEITPVSKEMMESAIIYEANIRQYSKEGTFKEFTKDIPQLKQLGVKIIWVMPIFPISETKRKAKGDLFVSDIEDAEERKKYLGSYYAVSDFTKVNPEFGDIEDFRKLINTAHDNGIYVILDWVPNHTGWDHSWLKTNPEFYTKNDKGEVTDPLNDDGSSKGWADVADLNYENEGLRNAMISDMKHWITKEKIDGFRCDVAGSVPTSFWEEAIPQLRQEKDVFMLAEAWEPELMHNNLFDMAYAWEGHHIFNEIAKGKQGVKEWDVYMKKLNTQYEGDDILMNFITNHDENSWNGTIEERMGNASEAMLALSYLTPGMPLIYSGQEYDMSHRLKFFEKDEILKAKGKMWPLLEKLGKLKNSNSALHGGKNAAIYSRVNTDNENVLIFKRSKNGSTIIFVANLTDEEQTVTNELKEKFLDYMSNTKVEFIDDTITLKPWEYRILL